MGLDAVEPTSYYFPADVDADYLHRLKQHAFLPRASTSRARRSATTSACRPAPSATSSSRSRATWIDHAAELDAPVIRIFAGNVPRDATEEQAVAWAIEGIKAVAAVRRREGRDAGPGEPRRDHGHARSRS